MNDNTEVHIKQAHNLSIILTDFELSKINSLLALQNLHIQ